MESINELVNPVDDSIGMQERERERVSVEVPNIDECATKPKKT